MARILTREDRQAHIDACRTKDIHGPWHTSNAPDAYYELLGDIATVNSNQQHDPRTGFHDWLPDTPKWVIDLAKQRNWA